MRTCVERPSTRHKVLRLLQRDAPTAPLCCAGGEGLAKVALAYACGIAVQPGNCDGALRRAAVAEDHAAAVRFYLITYMYVFHCAIHSV